jgi:hypothetical protein
MAGYATVAAVPALAAADLLPAPLGLGVSPLLLRSARCAGLWGFLMTIASRLDNEAQKRRLMQEVLRGTRKVTNDEFNLLVPGDGLGIPYTYPDPRGGDLLQGYMRIPSEDESAHTLICGDTRKGKSALMHHLLLQIAQRPGESCVIYDPALEFWRAHGRPARGDVLLHSLYTKCPYWSPSLEVENDLDPAALAMSFFPNRVEGRVEFWDEAPRQVFRFLIERLAEEGGGVSDLLRWLGNPDLIDEKIAAFSTVLAPLIDKKAAPQRSGVLATLNLVADSLKLLPPADAGRPHFSFAEWAEAKWTGAPRPWVFIGCRPYEREALKPLVSAWLDTAFCKLMKTTGGPRTWMFLDELPTLQRLPKLLTAVQEGGKYNLSFVLGFQGRAQLEQLYGKVSETLMSAPATRIFLGTKELAAAEWCAGNIGKPELERGTESVTTSAADGRDSMNTGTERRADYLVLPNEIQDLPKMEGYLRHGGYVTKFRFSYPDIRVVNNFEERAPTRRRVRPGLKLLTGTLHRDD